MMRFTRRPKKGNSNNSKDTIMGGESSYDGRNSQSTTTTSLPWRRRPGSSLSSSSRVSVRRTSTTSRSDSMKTLKDDQLITNTVHDVELEATATGDSNEQPIPVLQSSDDTSKSSSPPLHHPNTQTQQHTTDNADVQEPKYASGGNPPVPSTPTSQQRKPVIGNSSNNNNNSKGRNVFVPPDEINIDTQRIDVPLSPIRDFVAPQHTSGTKELRQDVVDDGNDNINAYCIEDITAMKRQLLDSQRLVRLILGKSLRYAASSEEIDSSLLDTNTVLQAIKSFAMMKQELITFRQRQELTDGDPSAILQTLGSPSTSSGNNNSPLSWNNTPSSKGVPVSSTIQNNNDNLRTGSSFSVTPNNRKTQPTHGRTSNDGHHRSGDSSSPVSPPSNSVIALWDAHQQIEQLKQDLVSAHRTIHSLQMEEKDVPQTTTTQTDDKDDEIVQLKEWLKQSEIENQALKYQIDHLASMTSKCNQQTNEDNDVDNNVHDHDDDNYETKENMKPRFTDKDVDEKNTMLQR